MALSKPMIVGGVAAAGALAYFLFKPKSAAAAPNPPNLPASYTPPTSVELPANAVPVSNSQYAPGYQGFGTYKVIAPNGLHVRADATTQSDILATAPYGAMLLVTWLPTSDGWVAVTDGSIAGYVCISCAEGGTGGPWLQMTDAG